MATETTPPLPVLRDGEYEIQDILAKGGMATVYKAHSRSLNGPVAIKVLEPRLASDRDLMVRFRGEAENIHNLHHSRNLAVVSTLVYLLFVLAVAYVIYQLLRDFVPRLRSVAMLA